MPGTDIRQLLPKDIYEALVGANSPSAANPYATIADIASIPSGWSLLGNTLSGGEILGSLNAQPLDFYTNNSARVRVTSGGIVGVGTITPNNNTTIHIVDSLLVGNTTSAWSGSPGAINIDALLTNNFIQWQRTSPAHNIAFLGADTSAGQIATGSSIFDLSLAINNGHSFNIYAQSASTQSFHVNGSSGKVGIGTYAPGATLDILNISMNNDIQRWRSSSGTEQMRFTETGFLGIGTTTPQFDVDLTRASATTSNITYNLRNSTSNGTSSYRIQSNNASSGMELTYYNSLFAPVGLLLALTATLQTNAANGLVVAATTNTKIVFAVNGTASNSEIARITSAGLGVGTTTVSSTFHNGGSLTESKWTIANGAYNILASDLNIDVVASGIQTLPPIASIGQGKVYRFYANPGVTATITADPADNIFGQASYPLTGGAVGASIVVRVSSVANKWVLGD